MRIIGPQSKYPHLAIAIVLVVFGCFPLVAGNYQRIIPLNDRIYNLTEELFISQGLAVPSSSRPWSCDEARAILDLLDEGRLSAQEKCIYGSLRAKVAPCGKVFQAGLDMGIEGYLHSNRIFDKSEDWGVGFVERKPFLAMDLQFSLLDNFYGFMGLGVKSGKFSLGLDNQRGESSWLGKHIFDTNFRFLYSPEDTGFESNTPIRAFVSIGGRGWTVSVGRDRLSWGAGRTGNLILGSHLQYHDAVRAAVYSPAFKYMFLVSSFPHPEEVWGDEMVQANAMGHPKLFVAHRFEGRLFGGRLGFAVVEGIMYQPNSGVPSLRVLNPMMLFHNLYSPGDMNSIAAFEFDFSFPRWNIYAQAALDEFTVSTEPSDSPFVHPNALGFIAGVRCVYPGFSLGLETALTDPSLYLRSKNGGEAQISNDDNMNYIVHIRRWSVNSGAGESLVYDPEFMGYRYGGDALAVDFNLEAHLGREGGLEAGFFYMAHGLSDKYENSFWKVGPEAYQTRFPSGGWNKASHTVDLRFGGHFKALPQLRLGFSVDWLGIFNRGHVVGDNVSDVQLVLSINWSIL